MAVRYRCTRKCFHGLRLYRIGDYAKFKNASDGPQDKKGKLQFFEIVDDGSPPIEKAGPKVKVNEKVI